MDTSDKPDPIPNFGNDLPDIKEFFDDSPDRGIAISLPAIVDNRVTSILKLAMRSNQKLLNELFMPSGALGNSGTRVSLLYMLGFVNDEVHQDLTVLNKIRNHFAHRVEIKTLEQHPINAWIKSMNVYKSVLALSQRTHPPSKEMTAAQFTTALLRAEMDTMRNCFRLCVRLMVLRLNELEQSLIASRAAFEEHLKQKGEPLP